MNEVHAISGLDVGEDGVGCADIQRVPADVRNLQFSGNDLGDGAHLTGDQAEACVLAEFKALVQQQLHAQAYAHHGCATSGDLFDQRVQAGLPELPSRITKCAHAGQDHPLGTADLFSIAGDDSLGANRLQAVGQ